MSRMLLPLISLLAVAAVGLWSYRRTRTTRDFFVAGQRVGLLATALATMATAFSGFVFLGGPGLTYRMGMASLAIVLPIGFTAGLLCWSLARRLRLLAEVREVFTIADAVAYRFDSRWTTGLTIVAILIGVVGYLGAQFLALAILLQSYFSFSGWLGPWSLPLALLLGWSLVVLYSVVGGMVAGIYTDVLQGVLMLVAAIAVFGRVLWVGDGGGRMMASLAASERFQGFFDPLAEGVAVTTLGFFLVFGIGVLGQPHMLHKFLMMRDPRQLRWLPMILGGSQALCLLIWVGLGLAVPALVAEGRMAPLVAVDTAAPRFLLEFGTPVLSGIVIAAVVAAIMSTADSFLNIGAAAMVRDLPKLLGRPPATGLAPARWATLILAVGAATVALLYGDLVALLGTFAFGTLGAALAPVLAIGLNWKRVNAVAASVAMATGMLVSVVLEVIRRLSPSGTLAELGLASGALPAAVATMASFTILMFLSWLTGCEDGEGIAPDIVAVMEA